MKRHFSSNLPYNNTTISVDQTQSEIQSMLKEFGVKGIRWTAEENVMNGTELPTLEFLVSSEIKGVAKDIGIEVKPVLLSKVVGREHIETPAPEQSMRLLYWWLKAKLEAVKFGLESIEHVLLSNVIVKLPDGGTTTIGESVSEQLQLPNVNVNKILPSFKILTDDEEKMENVISV